MLVLATFFFFFEMLLVRKPEAWKLLAYGVNIDMRETGAGLSTLGYSGESGLKSSKIFGK